MRIIVSLALKHLKRPWLKQDDPGRNRELDVQRTDQKLVMLTRDQQKQLKRNIQEQKFERRN